MTTYECPFIDDTGRHCVGVPGASSGNRPHRHRYKPTIEELLAFESDRIPANKREELIRAKWGISPARYHQYLTWAINTPEALAHDPATTNRLRRQRTERIKARAARKPTSRT